MATINGRACVANGRNLIIQSDLKNGYINRDDGGIKVVSDNFYSDNYIPTNGVTVFTLSSPDYAFKGSYYHTLAMYDSDKNYLGWQSIMSPTQTLSQSNTAYIRFSINFVTEGGTIFKLSDWLNSHRYKLETGTLATPLTPAPVDKVFSNGVQVYGRNLITGTSSILQTAPYSQNNSLGGFIHNFSSDELSILAGNQVTTRAFIHNTTTHTVNLMMWTNNGGVSVGTDVPAGTDGYSTIIYPIISSNNTIGNITIRSYTENVAISGVQYKEFKLEEGSVVTPWTPAPEDVM